MSTEDQALPAGARFGWIRPNWFLGGLALGLAFLAFVGGIASREDFHPGFVRFHSMISPEANYYPTLDEMCSVVRGQCRPGQVLVIVGGNSILLGVWQREADVWSRRLQEVLGDRYCVVNLAFRGASPTDGGAVVAEALRAEFPRQILIVNEGATTAVEAFGREPYRYLFWQGYYGGRLIRDQARDARIQEFLRSDPEGRRRALESRLAVWFNAVFHSNDFWNWTTFEHFGTVASYREEYFPRFLTPRRLYPDAEVDGTEPRYVSERYPLSSIEAEMRIVRGPAPYYSRSPGSGWVLAPATVADLSNRFVEAFPAQLRARTLVLVSGTSPYYLSRLSADELAMQMQALRDTVGLWRSAGYPAMDYGEGYTEDDFGDRTHLTKLGGWKLAAQVAKKVEAVSASLGYLR